MKDPSPVLALGYTGCFVRSSVCRVPVLSTRHALIPVGLMHHSGKTALPCQRGRRLEV